MSMNRVFRAPLLALALLAAAPAQAVQPDEMLADPTLEARAREVSRDIRCLVCRNENIDDSNAPLARDLRILLRERISAGDSDAQAKDFLVARYGEFVLLRPRFSLRTAMLWIGPLLALAFGLWMVRGATRRRAGPEPAAPAALSAEDQARVAAILNEKD